MNPKWTQDEIATIRALARTMPVSQIAEKLSRSESATSKKANEYGINVSYIRQNATDEDLAELRELAAQGLTVRQIAERLGVNQAAMRSRLYRAGIAANRKVRAKRGRKVKAEKPIRIVQPKQCAQAVRRGPKVSVTVERLVKCQLCGCWLVNSAEYINGHNERIHRRVA